MLCFFCAPQTFFLDLVVRNKCTRILIVKEGRVLADQMIQLSLRKIGRFYLVISSAFFFLVCLSGWLGLLEKTKLIYQAG